MKFYWRRWNKAIHRDLGYFFLGMTIIYCLSGIAINHLGDWNPNYIITTENLNIKVNNEINKENIKLLLNKYNLKDQYLNHYKPDKNELHIFLKNGNLTINLDNGNAWLVLSKKRPLFKPVNYLHYNPVIYWTWYSDIFSGALIVIGISGLFIIRGKNGITRRGAWLSALGILIPIIYLIIFYY